MASAAAVGTDHPLSCRRPSDADLATERGDPWRRRFHQCHASSRSRLARARRWTWSLRAAPHAAAAPGILHCGWAGCRRRHAARRTTRATRRLPHGRRLEPRRRVRRQVSSGSGDGNLLGKPRVGARYVGQNAKKLIRLSHAPCGQTNAGAAAAAEDLTRARSVKSMKGLLMGVITNTHTPNAQTHIPFIYPIARRP